MDWNAIILAVIGVLFSWETVNNIMYRRENKKLKQNEVKVSSVDTQKQQIELGDLFIDKSKEMFEKMEAMQEQTYNAILKNGTDNENIIKEIEAVKTEQKRQADEQKRLADEQNRQAEELKRLADGQGHMVTFVN